MVSNVPKYMIVTLIITGLYLSIEIPFSIHLVRILGGSATEADIDTVEKFGRILTGFAVALAYVGLRTFPRYHAWGHSFGVAAKAAIFRIIPIVALVYFGLHIYGEARGMLSTGEQRKEAFISNLAKRTIAEDGVAGITPSTNPIWLATVSGLPAVFSAERLVAMSGYDIRELSRREAIRAVGDVKHAHENFSADLGEQTEGGYSQFRESSRSFQRVIDDRDNSAEIEWNSYRKRLRSHFGDKIPRVGTDYHRRTLKQLREEGLILAGNFRLDDKAAFKLAVMKKITVEASEQFSKGIEENFGKGSRLRPNSSKQEFFADAGVQRRIRSNLGDIGIPVGVVLVPGMDASVFEKSVYPALIRGAADKIFDNANLYARGFTSNAQKETGEGAFKAATLPATALLLSLAGALFHMYKFSGYLMLVFGSAIRSRLLASKPMTHAFGLAMLTLAVFGMRSIDVTPSVAPDLAIASGGAYGSVIASAVSLQPGMFLIGDAMGKNGPWKLIGHVLPSPRLPVVATASAGVSNETTAAIIPTQEDKPVVVAEASEMVVPIPTPRPW